MKKICKSTKTLPSEILIEILSRLSLKSLSRCKCVSILWRQLSNSLTSKVFLQDHFGSVCIKTRQHQNSSNILFQHVQASCPPAWRLLSFGQSDHDDATITNLTPTLDRPRPSVSIPSCSSNVCQGLVCFFDIWALPMDLSPILVYSVTTHGIISLPTASDKPFSWKDNLWCFLGFEPVKAEYRVLRTMTSESLVSSYEVVTIGSMKWKHLDGHNNALIPSSLSHGRPCRKTSSLCIDGLIYWMHNSQTSNKADSDKILHIAAFDLGCEEFRAFNVDELVGCSYENNHTYFLTSLKGCPTLFFWKLPRQEILQMTLSDHNSANHAAWSRNISLISSSTLTDYWPPGICVYAGSSIIVQRRNVPGSEYLCYDFETGVSWVIQA